MSPDLLRLPPERDLPPATAARIRHRLLQPAGSARRARPPWLAPIASAAAVLVLAMVVGGFLALRPSTSSRNVPAATTTSSAVVSPTATPTPTATPLAPPAPSFRQAALTAGQLKAAVRACLTTMERAERASEVKVLGSRRVTTGFGAEDFVYLKGRKGALFACFGGGGTTLNLKDPQPHEPSASEPLIPVVGGGGGLVTSHDDRTVDRYDRAFAFRAHASVTRIRARILVGGTPGRWFEGAVVDGYAYAAAWLPGPTPNPSGDIDAVTWEVQAFDSAGRMLKVW